MPMDALDLGKAEKEIAGVKGYLYKEEKREVLGINACVLSWLCSWAFYGRLLLLVCSISICEIAIMMATLWV